MTGLTVSSTKRDIKGYFGGEEQGVPITIYLPVKISAGLQNLHELSLFKGPLHSGNLVS